MPPAPAFQCYSFKMWKIYICFLGQQNLHKGNLHREIEGKKDECKQPRRRLIVKCCFQEELYRVKSILLNP